MKPHHLYAVLLLFIGAIPAGASLGDTGFVGPKTDAASFPLLQKGKATPILVDAKDWPGVLRATKDLQADFGRVGGTEPPVLSTPAPQPLAIIIGTLGRSALIDRLAAEKKIAAAAIAGKWEAFLIQVVENPTPEIGRALVIAGSDKRGSIYGVYELSEQIGVSPWYYWADVPAKQSKTLFASLAAPVINPGPVVKYRGIFLNDEAPALTGWAKEKFGTLNSDFYSKIFELILRLRGNYLWPAMWSNAFNEDDPKNPLLADEYGIVMGTSHHEPMVRSQKEWQRHGTGPWNYETNAEGLRDFWTKGIERNKELESLVTLGMRGDGDLAMSKDADVALLETIVADQRKILSEHMNPDVTKIPQLWALYKEVQTYYEEGMRVPDDITLLWCDDNWGNIRRLPTVEERKRAGGAGIYYHFDYVGDPRSYKWLNTCTINKTWEQMNLAYRYGATRIWIVNVGDLKPLEFPIEFFLNLGWNPERWGADQLGEYTRLWAEREFGPKYATDIAGIMAGYTRLNARRKPELIEPDTFSLTSYREAERVLAEWQNLADRSEKIYGDLPEASRDAFYQLVLWPVQASGTVCKLYIAAGYNNLFAIQGRASTNDWAARVRALFQLDATLTKRYNEELAGGKWRHFADQTHLGYVDWSQPPCNVMPAISETQIPDSSELGIGIEGSPRAWPNEVYPPVRPRLAVIDAFARQTRWVDVFRRGTRTVSFTAQSSEPWLKVQPASGTLGGDQRLGVSVDWAQCPEGTKQARLDIKGSDGSRFPITVPIFNPGAAVASHVKGFVESDGAIAIEAAHYDRAIGRGEIQWKELPGYGRTHSGITPFPVTAESQPPGETSPRIEYDLHLFTTGTVKVDLALGPTLPFTPGRGIRLGVSLDDAPIQIIESKMKSGGGNKDWETAMENSVRHAVTQHSIAKPGPHVLKVWMIDPGLVLERIVIDTGGLRPSYLGPPESPRLNAP